MSIVRIVVVLAAVAMFTLSCGRKEESIVWVGSLQEALSRAQELSVPILVEVQSKTCKWCRTLEDSTLSHPDVVDFSKDFVWVRLDADADTIEVRGFDVFGYPTVLLLDPSGQEVDRVVGYRPPEEFMGLIGDYLAGRGTLESLRSQIQEDSTNVEPVYQLGRKYWERGRWQPTLDLFQKVVQMDPSNRSGYTDDALYGQGEALRRLGQTDQAVARFREVAASFPQSELAADSELEIGYTYQRAERTGEAVTAYQEFLRHYPEHEYADWVGQQLEKMAEQPQE